MSHREHASIESLLAQHGWVRNLALRLARDESAADDLVQDTWVAALRNPPHTPGPIRAWLGTVMRNRARERHRQAARRDAREARSARPDHSPAADVVVSRADALRHVVTTVLTLDEPYRTTILLLYFEGLTHKGVADRMQVPLDTVRTRARRALATLRARLDRDHGGDRRAWAVVVLGADVWERVGGSAAAGVRTSAVGKALGTGVMMATWKTIGATTVGIVAGMALTLLAQALGTKDSPPLEPTAEVQVAATVPVEHPPPEKVAIPETPPAAPTPAVEETNEPPEPEPEPDAADPVPVRISVPPLASEPVRGHVLFADGTPVSGATVRAFNWRPRSYPRPEKGPPPRETEAERIENARRDAEWYAATTHETVTGEDGTFALTGLRNMEYQMRAWAEGLVIRPARQVVQRPWPGDEFDFQAERRLPVCVSVRDADGNAPALASVRWTEVGKQGGGGASRWTPAQTTVSMRPGKWDVTATVEGKEEQRAGPVTVTVKEGAETPTVVLETGGVPRIRGRVEMHPTQRWSYVSVYAAPAKGGRAATDTELRNGLRLAVSGPRYEFVFDDLAPGTYTVAVALDHRAIDYRTTVTVGGGTRDCTLAMPHYDAKRAIGVRVTGPDHEPVEDVRFGLEIRQGSGVSSHGAAQGHLQADGRWLYRILNVGQPHWNGRSARWTLIVTSKTFGSQRVPFEHGRDESLEVRFDTPASVEITVQGASDGTRRRLAVLLVGKGESGFSALDLMDRENKQGLDADAHKTLSPVAPGTYDVQLWMRAALPNAVLVASQRISVGEGATRVDLRVPPLANVTVRAPGLEPGDRLSLSPVRDPGSNTYRPTETLDDSRTATWRGVPTGTYVVAGLVAGRRREMLLQVDASGTHTFSPGDLDGLQITIEEPYGKLANAGFATGDVVIRIDGASFRTRWDASALLRAADRKETIDFVVFRGGREVVVTARPTLFSGEPVGGHWEPLMR